MENKSKWNITNNFIYDNINIIDGCYIGQIDLLWSRDAHVIRIDAFPSPVNGDDADKPELDAFDALA